MKNVKEKVYTCHQKTNTRVVKLKKETPTCFDPELHTWQVVHGTRSRIFFFNLFNRHNIFLVINQRFIVAKSYHVRL